LIISLALGSGVRAGVVGDETDEVLIGLGDRTAASRTSPSGVEQSSQWVMDGWLKNVQAGHAISPFGAALTGEGVIGMEDEDGRLLDVAAEVGIERVGREAEVRMDLNCCGIGMSSFLGTPHSTQTGADSLALAGLL
jgi:hypothetical protein